MSNNQSILLVADNSNRNSYINNLRISLGIHYNVVCSEDLFWKPSGEFGILFLQWPERLSFRISRKSFPPTAARIKKITNVLEEWKKLEVIIIITRHNILPHHYSNAYEELYLEVYKRCHAIHHLGDFSKKDFFERYPQLNKFHFVIPHVGYWDIDNNITRSQARELLGIGNEKKVILAFGSFRLKKEEELLVNSFIHADIGSKLLIIPRGYLKNENAFYRLMDFIKFPIYKYLKSRKSSKLRKVSIMWNQDFVCQNQIQNYINASDVMVIPRINSLNSGNVYLGFTFGKVVCGPSYGNIGEELIKTGNPTFEVSDVDSVISALETSIHLSESLHGNNNFAYAESKLSYQEIGRLYKTSIYEISIQNK